MPKFTIKLVQFVEEIAEIEVEARTYWAAEAIVQDSIDRNMLEEDFDPEWGDGCGLHMDGIEIYGSFEHMLKEA